MALARRAWSPSRDPKVYNVLQSSTQLEWLERYLQAETGLICADSETWRCSVGEEHPKGKARATSIQLASDLYPNLYLDNYGACEGHVQVLKRWAEDAAKPKALHNSIFDQHVLANHGITLRGVEHDTLVTDYLLDTSREGRHGLEFCLLDHFGEKHSDYSEAFGWHPPKKNGEPQKLPVTKPHHVWIDEGHLLDKVVPYACKDTREGLRLARHHRAKMEATPWFRDRNYWEYYTTFERPFTDVLFRMERRGVLVDQEWLRDCGDYYRLKEAEALKLFYASLAEAGLSSKEMEALNPASPQQLGALFYERLGYPVPKVSRKTGAPSTDAEALEGLAAQGCVPVKHLLAARQVAKLIGTYVEPMLAWAPQYGGRIHSQIRQIGTVTGRIASSKPNLTNIPVRSTLGSLLRRAFVPPPGYSMIDGDLSQIEVRIAAHRSQDKVMLEYVRNDWDLHSKTAYEVVPRVRAAVDARFPSGLSTEALAWIKTEFPGDRASSKTLNFGVQYGAGAQRAASIFGLSDEEGQVIVDRFWTTYPGFASYARREQDTARQRGHIRTVLGRYCHLPGARSGNIWLRRRADRQALNYGIQSGAADIIKMGMILVDKDPRLERLGYKMLLQIHDEILGECPSGTAKEAAKIVEDLMGDPYHHFGLRPLTVPTPASVGVGRSWDASH